MTSLYNFEGKELNYINQCIESVLLQLNSSSNCYTTGDDDITIIKVGSSQV